MAEYFIIYTIKFFVYMAKFFVHTVKFLFAQSSFYLHNQVFLFTRSWYRQVFYFHGEDFSQQLSLFLDR